MVSFCFDVPITIFSRACLPEAAIVCDILGISPISADGIIAVDGM